MAFNIGRDARLAVIGYGSWATAIVKILLEKEQKVGWHVRNENVLEKILKHKRNPKYLSSVELDTSKLEISSDINSVIEAADIVVLAVPSAFLQMTLEPLKVPLKDKFIISAIKGIIPDCLLTVAEYVNIEYGIPFKHIGVLTGPCHAEEVALERLSYLNMVCTSPEVSVPLAERFSCDYICTNPLDDIYGTEYSAILKNIYAIATGIALGLGYGDNFISVLITNAANEMEHFLNSSYPAERNVNSSAYLGDLLVTCYSQFSRNRRLGLMIGKGYSTISAQVEMDMIAEGYYAAECIYKICQQKNIVLPISEMVYKVLYERYPARVALKHLSKKLL